MDKGNLTAKRAAALGAALACFTLARTAWADGFRPLARDLASAAKKQGLRRVAVLPFIPADGGKLKDGWNISEKLITQLVRSGKVQAVERTRLESLMDEHRLGRTGALDQAGLRKLGRLAAAEAIVTGSFVTLGRKVVINARLIDVETGVIIAAGERRAAREWFDLSEDEDADAGLFGVLREEPAEACAGAAERVNGLVAGILELKARYWAGKLRRERRAGRLSDPASSITDPSLKERFQERLEHWKAQRAVPALSDKEVRLFVAADGKAFTLQQACGI